MAGAVKRRLVIECGVAETRAALFDADEAVKFWFGPARGDETAPRAVEEGDICFGKVKTVSKPLAGAFVDIGARVDAFLPLAKGETAPIEGARLIVGVKRPALAPKGAVLVLTWRRGLAAAAQRAIEEDARIGDGPRVLGSQADPAVAFARKASAFKADEIIIDRADGAAALSGSGIAARIDLRAVDEAGLSSEIDSALARDIPLPGGGRMVIDETEALTAIDVDMGGLADNSRSSANDAVNKAAAGRLFRELARRAIGGRIVIDFLPPSSPRARSELLEWLTRADADLFPRRAGRLAPDGLFDMTAPRREASLLERATEPAGKDLVRQGRRETLDWRGKAAVFALERQLRRSPSAFFELLAAPGVAAYLSAQTTWIDRLQERYGARVTIVECKELGERRFDIAQRQTR